ncbi:hypothetical protein PYW07_010964 [Mythimna separata]|uniref:Uncharacterized protein n=1 Tax=Mythimna separata TaxID=271217 RepID=A0AAD8DLB2_MYTSE|nr:hypothetical protein PYW07_010964 [Mythimna separata]
MWLLLTTLALWAALLAPPPVRAENLKTAGKSLDFVNKVKEDLRRNNDDYELLEGENQLEQPPLPARAALHLPARQRPPPQRALPHYHEDARRGQGDVNHEVEIQGRMNQAALNRGDMQQGAQVQGGVIQGTQFQGGVSQTSQTATDFRSFTHARHAKRLHFNKQKKLLHRDKPRLQDARLGDAAHGNSFTPTTTLAPRLTTPAPPPPPPPRRTRTPRPSVILRGGHLREAMKKHSALHQNLERQHSPLHQNLERQHSPQHQNLERQNPVQETTEAEPEPEPEAETEQSPLTVAPARKNPLQEAMAMLGPAMQEMDRHRARRPQRNPPPEPDQIDMAHARNPVITRIRLKGRLCQRSMMNVEGPTYDGDGKQLVPEHDPRLKHGRLFNQTRAPDLLLPKCCNCCKKSVLGCQ